jgi:hypothetical protein
MMPTQAQAEAPAAPPQPQALGREAPETPTP